MEEYLIPTRTAQAEFVEKRSTFIGHVWPPNTCSPSVSRYHWGRGEGEPIQCSIQFRYTMALSGVAHLS